MQVRRTRSLSCPHVPWPASKHNDNLVHRALNRDGHLSCSRWWKRCAATVQTERWGPSCLTHTERDSFHHFSSWLSFKMDSDSRCDPNSLPLQFFSLRFSLSLLTRNTDFLYSLRLAHGARWIRSRLEKEGRGIWVRIEVLSQLRQRKNKLCLFYPMLLLMSSLILHIYRHLVVVLGGSVTYWACLLHRHILNANFLMRNIWNRTRLISPNDYAFLKVP